MLARHDRDEHELGLAVSSGVEGCKDVPDPILGLLVRLLTQPLGDVIWERHVRSRDGGSAVAETEPGLEAAGRFHVRAGHACSAARTTSGSMRTAGVESISRAPSSSRRNWLSRMAQFAGGREEAVAASDCVTREVAVLRDQHPLVVVLGQRCRLVADESGTRPDTPSRQSRLWASPCVIHRQGTHRHACARLGSGPWATPADRGRDHR